LKKNFQSNRVVAGRVYQKLREEAAGFVVSIRLSVRTERLDTQLDGFFQKFDILVFFFRN